MEQVRKSASIESVDNERRSFITVASDASVDRYGDIVSVDGWELDNFKRNPIALWGHSHQTPIGTVPKVWKDGSRLMAEMELAPAGLDPFVDKLWKFVQAGILRAVSVAFAPTVDPEVMRDEKGNFSGYKYLRQELLELSLVSVPANANAISLAKKLVDGEDGGRSAINKVFIHDDRTLERIAQSMRKRAEIYGH